MLFMIMAIDGSKSNFTDKLLSLHRHDFCSVRQGYHDCLYKAVEWMLYTHCTSTDETKTSSNEKEWDVELVCTKRGFVG